MIRHIASFAVALYFLFLPQGVFASPCWEKLAIQPLELLRWNTAQKLCGYTNMEHLWSSATVSKGPRGVTVLPSSPTAPADMEQAKAFMHRNGVRALLILHNGTILMEAYGDGISRETRWTSFSMAKSLTGLLVGAAVADGSIHTLDDPVSKYLPELQKGAYAKVTVRQVLTMTSGVSWDENYRNPRSDVARLAGFAQATDASFLAYMASRKRAAEPGTVFNYSTGEAVILGHLVRRATGKGLAAYMSEKIWSKLGMEHDAIWITDSSGSEISGCCFSATLRDYGRIGLFMSQKGRIGSQFVLPQGWMDQATKPSQPSRAQRRPYGYQIWVRDGGSYQASGIFGQMIHVDPARNLVIVMLSAWENATGTAVLHQERTKFIQAVKKRVDGP